MESIDRATFEWRMQELGYVVGNPSYRTSDAALTLWQWPCDHDDCDGIDFWVDADIYSPEVLGLLIEQADTRRCSHG